MEDKWHHKPCRGQQTWEECIREEKLLQLAGALENGAFCTVFSENFHKF
jgi:hypothetical protein